MVPLTANVNCFPILWILLTYYKLGTYIPVPEEPCGNLCTDYGNYHILSLTNSGNYRNGMRAACC